jgi:hypothetical protein
MHKMTPQSPVTTSALGEGETVPEVALEITALHPSPRATRVLRAQGFGEWRLPRLVVSAVLMGLAVLLTVVTPLHQAVWPLVAVVDPSATVTSTATPVRIPAALQCSDQTESRPHLARIAKRPAAWCPDSPN